MLAELGAKVVRVARRLKNLEAIAAEINDGASMPEKLDQNIWNEIIQINLNGVWHGCQEAGVRMLADGKGGSIINVSSIMGLGGSRRQGECAAAWILPERDGRAIFRGARRRRLRGGGDRHEPRW